MCGNGHRFTTYEIIAGGQLLNKQMARSIASQAREMIAAEMAAIVEDVRK